MKRWLALAPLLAGCPRIYRVTEGVTASLDRKIGGEVTATAGRFVGEHETAGLRAGVMIDGNGTTAIVGITIDAERLPPRDGPWYGEAPAPFYGPPHGLALRAGLQGGTTAAIDVAVMKARGDEHDLWIVDGEPYEHISYFAWGLELGAEVSVVQTARWVAVRAVQEWDKVDHRRSRRD